jgi:hypothetical protein
MGCNYRMFGRKHCSIGHGNHVCGGYVMVAEHKTYVDLVEVG